MRRNGDNRVAPLRLCTDREGLGMVLGPLELRIMQQLWQEGLKVPCSNKEMQFALCRAGHDLAIATVSTTMHRLAEKGYLLETQGKGRLYTYSPSIGEDDLEVYVVQQILERLRDEWPDLVEDAIHGTDQLLIDQ